MLLAWTILILTLSTALAEAAGSLELCRALGRNDPVAADRCATHVRFFETPPQVIEACTKFSDSLDLRFRCLKSGASLEVYQLCSATGWSMEVKISCLRAYPSKEILQACKRLGGDENRQLQCVRMGREAGQISGCTEMMPDAESRLQCMQANVPTFNARLCGVAHKKIRDRLECLEAYAEERDTGRVPAKPRRMIANEAPKNLAP
ncbi:MAG: hypothetical protein EOP11_12895 [Proteobacteria bacterium]|nr:MAG: hypothetical protein EOP11_12895 [Pseudomonadota bacterium]